MYTVTRKNGSFPGGKRTLRFFSYDEMRAFLRSYFRKMTGQDFKRSTHPSLSYILLCFPLTIKKSV